MMKINLISFVLLVSTFFLNTQSAAQNYEKFGFNIVDTKKRSIHYPFELKANLVLIKVVIDQSDSLNFVLDTGVRGIILLDTTINDQINISYSRPIKIRGLGPNDVYEAMVSTGHTIQFGKIRGNFQNIVILQDDLINFSDFIGAKIHGIIGSDIFNRFNIKINYYQKRLTFSNPENYQYKKRKGEIIDLHFEKNKPYIKSASILLNNQEFDSLNLVVDTGGSHALLLNREAIPEGLIPTKLVEGNLGRGLSGKLSGKLGRINTFNFAGRAFKQVITAYPENIEIGTEEERYAAFRQGSIGGEILKRFIVTFNYQQEIMVLKPIFSELKKPFTSDMSGIDLKLNSETKDFEIVSIVPNSAADHGGLLPGDIILFVNKIPTSTLSLSEIYQELRKKNGYPIFMIIRRNNGLEMINFKLIEII